MSERHSRLPRRSFLAKAGGAAAAGAAMAAGPSMLAAQSAPPAEGRFQAARHAQDDWFDQVPGKHRFFLDTVTAGALGQAIFFVNNYYTANKSGYGLDGSDLAVVICMRHQSTGFAYGDAIWAKYGESISERAAFVDPKTQKAPTANLYRASGYPGLRNSGVTLDSIIKNGTHFAVCQMATRNIAATIARNTGGNADDLYKELVANLIPNAHIVPAGIVAVARAQERGYSFASVE
jgi:hypothetical protein